MLKKTHMPLLWDDPVEKLEVGPNHWLVKEMVLSEEGLRKSEQRFLKFIEVKESGCWVFTGCTGGFGYGQFYFAKKTPPSHRVSWMLYRGAIPEGLQVLHGCDNPPCVNPDHLFLGTQQDNIDDCIKKGRSNHARGERVNTAVLNESQVLDIRRIRSTGMRLIDIARKFGVERSGVGRICNRKIWKHI